MKLEANIEQLARILYGNITADVPTLLFGQPGLGKTSVVEQLAEKLASRFTGGCIVLSTTEENPIDAAGLWEVQDGKTVRVPSAHIPLDKPVLILIDEFADCPVYEQSAWYRLLLSQQLGQHKLAPGSYVCAATNRPEDNAAAREVSKAAIGRCCCVTLRADYESLLKFGYKNNWHSTVLGFVRAYGTEVIDAGFNPECPYGGSTPRDFSRLNALESAGLISSDDDTAILQIVGNIGPDAGSRYLAFRQLELPSVDDVFKSPTTAEVDLTSDKIFAYSAAITSAAKPENYPAVIDYCLRLPRVAGFGLAWDLLAKDKVGVTKSPAFSKLAIEYSELVA